MRWLAIGVAVLAASLANDHLAISVTPLVLFEGHAVRVRCHVPLNVLNRRLQIALDGYRYSELPINGDEGPVTTEVTYDHVPCEVTMASCTTRAVTGEQRRVEMGLTIVCRL